MTNWYMKDQTTAKSNIKLSQYPQPVGMALFLHGKQFCKSFSVS